MFRRQREEGVQPVQKEDVPVVLRRRFFEPDDPRNLDGFRPHVIGIVRDLARLEETTARNRSAAEERFLASFPFHPDLTDALYSRWTQLEGFQRTRGILRTLATALREAERWDAAPLIGLSALLAAPGRSGVSEAVRELAGVATSETVEGARTDGSTLLEAELEKARQIVEPAPPPPVPSVPGALLEGCQIQDLAELIPKLLEASAGNDLRFRVGQTLNQDAGGNLSEEVRAAPDELLSTVSADLKIE